MIVRHLYAWWILCWARFLALNAETELLPNAHPEICPITQEMLDHLMEETVPCKIFNSTLFDDGIGRKYTPRHFLRDLAQFQNHLASTPISKLTTHPFWNYFEDRKIFFPALEELQTMKYIWSCPIATFGAAIVNYLFNLESLHRDFLTILADPVEWERRFWKVGLLGRCANIFFAIVAGTGEQEQRSSVVLTDYARQIPLVRYLIQVNLRDYQNFFARTVPRVDGIWEESFQPQLNDNGVKVDPEAYREFLISIRAELNTHVSNKVIDFWTIGRGTLMASMRYGEGSSALPSGIIDYANNRLDQQAMDVDVYVSATKTEYTDLCMKLSSSLQSLCSFCGFQRGYQTDAFVCYCYPFELDLTRIPSRVWSHAAQPLSKCVLENVELPCPGDVGRFQAFIWPGIHNWIDCLHLPPKDKYEITKEDVEFIWQRSVELHSRGYQNFARFYDHVCTSHPMGEYAHSLFLDALKSGT